MKKKQKSVPRRKVQKTQKTSSKTRKELLCFDLDLWLFPKSAHPVQCIDLALGDEFPHHD